MRVNSNIYAINRVHPGLSLTWIYKQLHLLGIDWPGWHHAFWYIFMFLFGLGLTLTPRCRWKEIGMCVIVTETPAPRRYLGASPLIAF